MLSYIFYAIASSSTLKLHNTTEHPIQIAWKNENQWRIHTAFNKCRQPITLEPNEISEIKRSKLAKAKEGLQIEITLFYENHKIITDVLMSAADFGVDYVISLDCNSSPPMINLAKMSARERIELFRKKLESKLQSETDRRADIEASLNLIDSIGLGENQMLRAFTCFSGKEKVELIWNDRALFLIPFKESSINVTQYDIPFENVNFANYSITIRETESTNTKVLRVPDHCTMSALVAFDPAYSDIMIDVEGWHPFRLDQFNRYHVDVKLIQCSPTRCLIRRKFDGETESVKVGKGFRFSEIGYYTSYVVADDTGYVTEYDYHKEASAIYGRVVRTAD